MTADTETLLKSAEGIASSLACNDDPQAAELMRSLAAALEAAEQERAMWEDTTTKIGHEHGKQKRRAERAEAALKEIRAQLARRASELPHELQRSALAAELKALAGSPGDNE